MDNRLGHNRVFGMNFVAFFFKIFPGASRVILMLFVLMMSIEVVASSIMLVNLVFFLMILLLKILCLMLILLFQISPGIIEDLVLIVVGPNWTNASLILVGLIVLVLFLLRIC